MKEVVRAEKPWDTGRYLTIVGASFQDGVVTVEFQDGGRAEFAVADLRLDRPRAAHWERLRVDDVGLAVVVPAEGDDLELTGFWIRSLTDPEFAAHLKARAEESARTVGRKLAGFRAERGMTVDEVAARSGLSTELIERIERGEAGNDLRPQDAILAALGRGWRDLYDVEADAETEVPVP